MYTMHMHVQVLRRKLKLYTEWNWISLCPSWLYRLFRSQLLGDRDLTSKPMIVKTFEIRKILRRLQILIRMVVMTISCAIMERFLHGFVKATTVIINDVSTVKPVTCFWQSQCTYYQGKCYYFLRVDLHGEIFTYAKRMRSAYTTTTT